MSNRPDLFAIRARNLVLVYSALVVMGTADACFAKKSAQAFSHDFEVSNEIYLQGGLNPQEYPTWTFIDLELDLDLSVELNRENDHALVVGFKIGTEYDANEHGVESEEYFVGYQFLGSQFGYGAKEYATEHFGLDNSISFGRKTTFEQFQDSGRSVFFYERKSEDVFVSISTDKSKEARSYDLFLEYDLNDVWQFAAAAQHLVLDGEEDVIETLGVSAKYEHGNSSVFYSFTHNTQLLAHDFGVERTFSAGHSAVIACGIERLADSRNQTQCFTNFTYAISDNVFASIELGYLDTQEASGIGYLIGLEIEF